jgi:hypothetical protein
MLLPQGTVPLRAYRRPPNGARFRLVHQGRRKELQSYGSQAEGLSSGEVEKYLGRRRCTGPVLASDRKRQLNEFPWAHSRLGAD